MKKLTHYAILFLLFLVAIFPFYLLLVNSVKYQMQIYRNPWVPTLPMHLDNYRDAAIKVIKPLFNSVLITVMAIAVTASASLLASYAFSRGGFPFRNLLYTVIIALLMVPGFALLVPQFVQFNSLGLTNTYLGQALPPATNSIALGVMLMTSFFDDIPKSIYESAELDGAGDGTILVRIVVPMSKPIVASVSIMTGLATWNNFVWSLVITQGEKVRPVILAITTLAGTVNQGDGLKLAGYVIAALPILILFFFATKPFVEGITAGAVKG